MIEVVQPGLFTTVQDLGRSDYAHWGVPQAGAMDAISAQLANKLLENPPEAAYLEINLGQGKFRFEQATWICLSGGDFSPELDGERIKMNKPTAVKAHSLLSFGKRRHGARTYLAVAGGILSRLQLGSRSFSPGFSPQKLAKGDRLAYPVIATKQIPKNARPRLPKSHFESSELKAFPGPEFQQLKASQRKALRQEFSLSRDADRVGIRLVEKLENDLPQILSGPVLPGTVQLTPSGSMIILMRDCQVSGGYPRILQLSEAVIARLGQKMPGDTIQFQLVE